MTEEFLHFIDPVVNYINQHRGDFLIGLGIIILSSVFLALMKVLVVKRLKILTKRTRTKADDYAIEALERIPTTFFIFLAIYLGLLTVQLPENLKKASDIFIIIVFTYYLARFLQKIINYSTARIIQARKEAGLAHEASVVRLASMFVKATIWAVAALFILSNFNVNITSILAGLGIGGVAFALIIQNIVGDLFSSLSIYIDKPFQVGDFIEVGEDSGEVQKIGIRSTRILTLEGDELTISNKELTDIRIRNWERLQRRRHTFHLQFSYQNNPQVLRHVPDLLKKIINSYKLAEFSRAHLEEFGDYSLKYEVVYYVNSHKFMDFIETKQKINLKILEALARERIELAYPTQDIYLKTPAKNIS